MSARNLLNHNNPGPIIGNITSPLFGLANQMGGFGGGGGGYGGGFNENANNRRLELQMRFSFIITHQRTTESAGTPQSLSLRLRPA